MTELWNIPDDIAGNANNLVELEFLAKRAKAPQGYLFDRVHWLEEHPDEVGSDEIELASTVPALQSLG